MHEKRKDPEYRRKENERRKFRMEQRKKAKEEEMRHIPPLSFLSENTNEVGNKTGPMAKTYIIRREMEVIKVTTFIHEGVEEANKENRQELVVYRAESGAIGRAHPTRT